MTIVTTIPAAFDSDPGGKNKEGECGVLQPSVGGLLRGGGGVEGEYYGDNNFTRYGYGGAWQRPFSEESPLPGRSFGTIGILSSSLDLKDTPVDVFRLCIYSRDSGRIQRSGTRPGPLRFR